MMRRAVLAASLCLAGCTEQKARDVAACELQSRQVRTDEALERSNAIADDITLCMRAKGYAFGIEAGCRVSPTSQRDIACYTAESLLQ